MALDFVEHVPEEEEVAFRETEAMFLKRITS
jgi:hypothetical protein